MVPSLIRRCALLALPLLLPVAACGGNGTDEVTPTVETAATSTSSPTASDAPIVLSFDEWDATLTIPAGALPAGVLPADLVVEPLTPLPNEDGTIGLAAGFHLEPDGIALSAPAVLELTIPLDGDTSFSAMSLDDDGTVDFLGEEDFSMELIDVDEARVTLRVSHFSDWLVGRDGAPSVRVEPEMLAARYFVGEGLIAQAAVSLPADIEATRTTRSRYDRFFDLLEVFEWTRGVVGAWSLSANWHYYTGPVSPSFPLASADASADADQVLLVRGAFDCDAPGAFELRVYLSVSYYSPVVNVRRTYVVQGVTQQVRRSVAPGPQYLQAWTSAGFTSRCVQPATATVTPVTSPPTATVTPVTSPPTATVTPVTSPPTATVTAVPESELERQLRLIEEALGFNADFENGSCAQYPASYSQDLTLDFSLPNNLVLKQAQHVNTGTVNLTTGAALLVEPGIERYEIVFTADGQLLRFAGQYFFNDGSGECRWAVSGSQR